jgi:hypothetical protein
MPRATQITDAEREARDILRNIGWEMVRHADNPESDIATQIKQLRQTADILERSIR